MNIYRHIITLYYGTLRNELVFHIKIEPDIFNLRVFATLDKNIHKKAFLELRDVKNPCHIPAANRCYRPSITTVTACASCRIIPFF